MGSNVLTVVERALVLTTQTSVRLRHMPALKNEVCEAIRLPLLSAEVGSIGSRASRGKVMTVRSRRSNKDKAPRSEGRKPTCQNNQELVLLEDIDLRYLEEGKYLDRVTSALSEVREINTVIRSIGNLPSLVCEE